MWTRIKAFWRTHKDRYLEAVNRYGVAVILTAIVTRVVMATAVVVAYKAGWGFTSLEIQDAGAFGAAWIAVWPLAPVRWILAAVIAPPLVRWLRRIRGLDPDLPPVHDEPAEPTP